MELKIYIGELPRGGVAELAAKLRIHPVYLSQLAAAQQDKRVPSPALCLTIERATSGAVTRQELRPNDYWLIWPDLEAPALANTAQPATETVAAGANV